MRGTTEVIFGGDVKMWMGGDQMSNEAHQWFYMKKTMLSEDQIGPVDASS